MVEGVVSDLAQAKVPNIPKEMGVRAEWQLNKKGLAAKIGIAALIGGERAKPASVRDRPWGVRIKRATPR